MVGSSDASIAVLKVQYVGNGASDVYPFNRRVLNIGRADDNDVILEGLSISRHHMRVEFLGDQILVTDLGSINGVIIKGQIIPIKQPTRVQFGDAIDLTEYHLVLQPGSSVDLRSISRRVKFIMLPGIKVVVSGSSQKYLLEKPVTTLGRTDDNDIFIEHGMVSRHHAKIKQQNGIFIIEDLNSANGLFFNRQRVQQRLLTDGAVISIGSEEVTLQYCTNIGFLPVEAQSETSLTLWQPEKAQEGTGFLNLKAMEVISIGRSPDNRIVINHPQVSLHHALLERMGTRYRIRDLKSEYGVFINGQRIEKEGWLKEGNELRIGGKKLLLREDGIQQYSEEGIRIDVVGLNKWISREKNLLQDISLSIYPQEFIALVGMSGSGKSTLMDAINGFRPATQGEVTVNGIDLYRNFDMFRSEMGYVPQKDIVHQELLVYSALDYSAQLRMPSDTNQQERHQRIMEVLQDLDLTERKDLPIHRLSGGQLKRVSIGVELLTKPRLFFLDEPTSGLDPGTEAEMMKLLRKLADQGRTILLITHATKNVMMCDKVIFLARGGYLAYYGPPEEALPYFNQFRTSQEQQQKEMEFDDIYAILNDERRGSGKNWGERYEQSIQYRENVINRLQDRSFSTTPTQTPESSSNAYQHLARKRPQVGTLRQFIILSLRNLKIIVADKFGLAMMLAVAPILGLLDFVWGNNLFDPATGDAIKIKTMFFMAAVKPFLSGGIASVREIVKEADIYKRERAINLKLLSYISSKVWIGVVISGYQAVVLLFFQYIFILQNSPINIIGYVFLLITIFIISLSGYMIGLCVSAAVPNQNVAMLVIVVTIVPQFLFTGSMIPLDLIPGGGPISYVISCRWAFEAMVNISGIGKDLMEDPCWQFVDFNNKQPSDLTDEQKASLGCKCMGVLVFTHCQFPGIRNPEFYTTEAQSAIISPRPNEPDQPTPYPSPTPYATFTPLPPPSDPGLMQQYQNDREKQGKEYADLRLQQGNDYGKLRTEQGDEYASAMKAYGNEREKWQRERARAISSAESTINAVWNKNITAFKGDAYSRWFVMCVIVLVEFGLLIVFQKRKDVV